MRLGPAMLATGLLLVVAGIVSSAADLWRVEREHRSLVIDVASATTLDIGGSRLDTIEIGEREAALLEFTDIEADKDIERVAWHTKDGVVVLEAEMPYSGVWGPRMLIPLQFQTLKGVDLRITSTITAPALRIEASDLSWTGGASDLDIHALPIVKWSCSGLQELSSKVLFTGGKVGTLRISMEGGRLVLGDLSEVGDIELRVGNDVGIKLARVADLSRIRVLPFDGEPAKMSHDARKPPQEACTQVSD